MEPGGCRKRPQPQGAGGSSLGDAVQDDAAATLQRWTGAMLQALTDANAAFWHSQPAPVPVPVPVPGPYAAPTHRNVCLPPAPPAWGPAGSVQTAPLSGCRVLR